MKGMVFTEFFTMVEDVFGEDMVDHLIDATQPQSLGAYTAVGAYDYAELEAMVVELSLQTNTDVSILLQSFGKHLGAQFASKYSAFFLNAGDTFSFLREIDRHIHVEVKKLYPDAELPEFDFENISNNQMILNYRSNRPLADLAHGLIVQTALYFDEKVEVQLEKSKEGDINICMFTINKV